MNKLTAEVARRDIGHLKSFQSDPKVGLSLKEEKYLQALEIALPVLEQQERKDSLSNNEGLTEDDRHKIPSLPEMVSAQDMRETLNVPMHEEEAQAAANGFNQCLMECAPIYQAAIRRGRGIDECLKEIDAMQESINHTHKRRAFWRNRAEAAEAKLAALEQQQPPTDTYRQIENDGWIEWGGGPRPCAISQVVNIRHRNGVEDTGYAGLYEWKIAKEIDDIIAYRVIENDGREG